MSKRLRFKIKFEYKITLIYLIFGFMWIFFSDTFFNSLNLSRETLKVISISKGFAYVIITSLLLFILVRRHMRHITQAETIIKERKNELEKQNQELQTAKEQIKESETFLESIFENIPDMIFVKDATDLRFVRFNKAGLEFLGYTEEELIGKNDYDFFSKDEADFFTQKDREVFYSEKPIIIEEEKINTKYGSKILHTRKIAIKDKYGNNGYLLGISEDITAKKQIQNELIKAKEKAEESDRFKTAFLQNISHEIRTPMNAIIGFSDLLGNPNLLEDNRKKFISIIQNSSHQLLSIVNDIITISTLETKQEKLYIKPTCLNTIMTELYTIFENKSLNENKLLLVHSKLTDAQSEIYIDKIKLTQILINLIANALKFTQNGTIEYGYTLKNKMLEFFVKDSGIGIQYEMQEKIFERFCQAHSDLHRVYGGTGLGLSISKGFVELMDGKIWVESELQKGSTFYFTIPYNPVNDVANPNSKQTLYELQTEKNILIAEDDENNFLYINELLQFNNINVIRAKNGLEAVAICHSNQNIHIVLMDINMPIMNGYTAAQQIKESLPFLPIIAQTAYALEQEKQKYSGTVFDEYLTKPIDKPAFYKTLKKYIGDF